MKLALFFASRRRLREDRRTACSVNWVPLVALASPKSITFGIGQPSRPCETAAPRVGSINSGESDAPNEHQAPQQSRYAKIPDPRTGGSRQPAGEVTTFTSPRRPSRDTVASLGKMTQT